MDRPLLAGAAGSIEPTISRVPEMENIPRVGIMQALVGELKIGCAVVSDICSHTCS